MAASIQRIPVLNHSPLHRIVASWMSDEDQPVHVHITLGLNETDRERSSLYSKNEGVLIDRLHRDRLRNVITFSGAAYARYGDGWRRKYRCAGKLYLNGKDRRCSWLVDTEASELFTDCVDSPLPMLWWQRAMHEASDLVFDLVGDYQLGSEIVRRTVSTLSRGMRRLPNICPDCGQEVTRSDWGNQKAYCPTHGQLGFGGDMVLAIGRFEDAFDLHGKG